MVGMKAHKKWDKRLVNLYEPVEGRQAQVAAFMSGSGTNVERVLEHEERLGSHSPFHVAVIVTDNPGSNAEAICEAWAKKGQSLDLVVHDIKAFYRARGMKRFSIRTEKGQAIRGEYTDELRGMMPDGIDFYVLGGFEPLTNIVGDKPSLNVHPGDLTVFVDGQRYIVGLHTVPIQRALELELDYVRSSVILARPYSGAGGDMDTGPLLALGPKMMIGDERDPKIIQNCLKEASDWKVLPVAVEEVARGNFAVDFRTNKVYHSTGDAGIVMPETAHIDDILRAKE